ncbi:MFS monosaccharide transporter (Hxt8) [Sporothrix brasiliensis 5110]|uniref:MFS monosaccharide transporter (Hxt8) n=1 Tax=Sporothrix brasiliensis 5110 TaxID=1398154 RepID=A0A0C2J5G9_9PEZI|nr:MFS monosaccharide transporter (Hxt8) [Sporothrix brasiliensis 5110]KIH92297.1 MFS monosaccharide transporter (Hxt8) [Sporothrix brasiliensis 5110]
MTTAYQYAIGVALFASIGTFLFGFDTGIATTTISHDSWKDYMGHPGAGLTGAVVAVFIAGEALGSITQFVLGDRLGRLGFLQFLSVVVTIGAAVQTGAVNMGMFLAGRAIAGVGIGGLVASVPLYLVEISAPSYRGFIGSISGCGMTAGIMVANWVGYACAHAPYGSLQWRLPLGLQIPWGVLLFLGLVTFMPDSPRMLIRKGRVDAARRAFAKIRRDLVSDSAVADEFRRMQGQIEYEMAREITSYRQVFALYRRRALVAISIQVMTSLTGVNVIQYYQTTLYTGLGMGPMTILALAGVYGTVSFLCNCATTFWLIDQWGRRKMLLTGMAGIVLVEIYTAEMQRGFATGTNHVGQGFAILGIFLFAVVYYSFLGSTVWIYPPEILPLEMRNKVVALATASHFVVNIGITEAGPTAFKNIAENYYYVFVGCTIVMTIVGYFFYPETRKKSLEEIAGAFGDPVVTEVEDKTAGQVEAVEEV